MLIYIVEDDEHILRMEEYALKSSGFEVRGFFDEKNFFRACEEKVPSLVVLDIMLPDTDGIEILHRMKSSNALKGVPIIMATARSSEMDIVSGLDMGADDYISKPFGVMEFISRVKAVLRRVEKTEENRKKEHIFKIGDIDIDDSTRTVSVSGSECLLTYKEYELLKYFIINQGLVLSREKLMENVWGMDYKGETRTIDVHVQSLRKKLKSGGAYIETVRNVGYRFKK